MAPLPLHLRRLAPLLAGMLLSACTTGTVQSTTTVTSPPATNSPPPSSTTVTAPPGTVAPSQSTTRAFPPATTGPSAPTEAPVGQRVVIDVDGRERAYVLYMPPSYDGTPIPLIVDLHALLSDPGEQAELSGLPAGSAARGFIVVEAEGRGAPDRFWDAVPGSPGLDVDLAYVRAIVTDVSSDYAVDPGRVYAAGFSNGGGMAHRLACAYADVFAAIAVVAGAHPLSALCDPSQPVAVIGFHGTEDRVVAYDGIGIFLPAIPDWAAGWAERDSCTGAPSTERISVDVSVLRWGDCADGVEVELFTVDGGGHGWPGTSFERKLGDSTRTVDATDLILDFFARHARS